VEGLLQLLLHYLGCLPSPALPISLLLFQPTLFNIIYLFRFVSFSQHAHELAIEPMVDAYVRKWTALEVSDEIQVFRRAVEAAVEQHLGVDLETSPKAKPVRAMIHPHVMTLREGRPVDLDQVLHQIRNLNNVTTITTTSC
jgi:hypothetical protein